MAEQFAYVIARCPSEWCSMYWVPVSDRAACRTCGLPFLPSDRQIVRDV